MPNIGNLGAPQGHPSSYYTGGGVTAGTGYHIQGTGTHPALQHILGTGTTALGTPPGSSPPGWWPQGAPWPPARNWFGPPPAAWGGGYGNGDPYGPPTQAPPGADTGFDRPVGPPPPHWSPPAVQPPTGPSPLLSYLNGYYSVMNGG